MSDNCDRLEEYIEVYKSPPGLPDYLERNPLGVWSHQPIWTELKEHNIATLAAALCECHSG